MYIRTFLTTGPAPVPSTKQIRSLSPSLSNFLKPCGGTRGETTSRQELRKLQAGRRRNPAKQRRCSQSRQTPEGLVWLCFAAEAAKAQREDEDAPVSCLHPIARAMPPGPWTDQRLQQPSFFISCLSSEHSQPGHLQQAVDEITVWCACLLM